MSLLKRLSCLVIVSAIFSFALSVSAQSADQPEVYVKDLKLDKTEYSAGDTISGSFTLLNARDMAVPNMQYMVFLMGDYENTLPTVQYDNSAMVGPIFLSANESKTINFEYKLPVAVGGEALGIQVRAMLDTGLTQGWEDVMIKVSGGLGFATVEKADITVGQDVFGLQDGPMVYPGGKAILNITLKNDTKTNIDLTPTVKIFDRSEVRGLLNSFTAKPVSIPANQESQVSIELPTFEYTPRVYFGQITFNDGNGIARASKVEFRYIVYGDIVTINSLTSDKSAVKEGEELNIFVGYSGAPMDILNGQIATTSGADFNIKVFNQKDEIVADYSGQANFNQGSTSTLSVTALKDAKALRAEMLVTKDGKTLATYNSLLSSDYDQKKNEGESWLTNLSLKSIIVIVFVLLLLLALVFKEKLFKIKLILVIVILILVGLVAGFLLVDQTEAWTRISYSEGDYSTITSVFVNSPSGNYTPGQTFNFTFSATVNACSNHGRGNQVTSVLKTSTGALVSPAQSFSSGKDYAIDTAVVSFSNFSQGSYTAPSTPGNYRIYFDITVCKYGLSICSEPTTLKGYQDFSVIENGACGTTRGACVTGTYENAPDGTLRYFWNCIGLNGGTTASCSILKPVNGACSATHYNCTAGTLGSTAEYPTSSYPNLYAWQWWCNGTNDGTNILCTEYKTPINGGWSAWSPASCPTACGTAASTQTRTCTNPAPANGGATCVGSATQTCAAIPACSGPLSGSCSVSTTTTSINTPVNWTAAPAGGTGPYTYLWSGSTGIVSGTNTTNPEIISYNTLGTKTASVKITDSVNASTTVSCSNNVVVATSSNPLTVTCSVSPSSVPVGGTLNWSASVDSGGVAPYTYSWTGTDGLTSTLSSVSKSYDTEGTKDATVTVTDAVSSTVYVNCPGTGVSDGSGGGGGGGGGGACVGTCLSPTAGTCGTANNSQFIDATSLQSAVNRCGLTGSTSTPATFSGEGPWSWTCSGINGSNTPSPLCSASKIATTTPNPNLNCTLELFNPHNAENVNVNTQTTWSVSSASTTIPFPPSYTVYWTVNGVTDPTPVSNSTFWDKIFTTTGQKNVSAQVFSGTSSGTACSASTNVVLTGGILREI